MKQGLILLLAALIGVALLSYFPPSCQSKQGLVNEITIEANKDETAQIKKDQRIKDQLDQLDDDAVYQQLLAEDCRDCEPTVGGEGVQQDFYQQEGSDDGENDTSNKETQPSIRIPQPTIIDDSEYDEYPPIDLDQAFEELFMTAPFTPNDDSMLDDEVESYEGINQDDPCFGIVGCEAL